MSASRPDESRVALALTINAEPGAVRGELADAAGGTWSFEGWLEFVAAVDAARGADAARSGNESFGYEEGI